jgi:hypothetical protein
MKRALTFLFGLLTLLLLGAACGQPSAPPNPGTVVVGVTSDLRVGVDILSLHATLRASGAVMAEVALSTSSTTAPLKLPAELPFDGLAAGTAIDVTIDAYGPGSSTTPLLTRYAATTIVGGKKLLLEVELDSRCIVGPGSSAPTCTEPQTCVAGVCVSAAVPATMLPAYTAGWATMSTDPCKPAGAGAPIVIVGQGQADYLPLMNGDTAQVEAGPQGGHHIWVALRAKNLHQSGSITSITGHFPDLGIDVGPFNVIFTMEVDEGGYCKLYGLRFQLDEVTPIAQLLGHPLDVTATITDTDASVGVGKVDIVLSTTFTM